MKTKHRLDYHRLAEALGERGLVPAESLQHVLQQCASNAQLFPEILVNENLISDWEIARVVTEVFNLPFLTPQVYSPTEQALQGIDKEYLHEHGFIPLDRFGKVMTVAMPALTPSDVLGNFMHRHGVEVIPVVSTVLSNRTWLYDNMQLEETLPPPPQQPQEGADLEGVESALPALEDLGDDWANLFDEGDAAVLMDLEVEGGDVDEPGPAIPDPEELAAQAAAVATSEEDEAPEDPLDDDDFAELPELPKLD